jgi:hypothetical protein
MGRQRGDTRGEQSLLPTSLMSFSVSADTAKGPPLAGCFSRSGSPIALLLSPWGCRGGQIKMSGRQAWHSPRKAKRCGRCSGTPV